MDIRYISLQETASTNQYAGGMKLSEGERMIAVSTLYQSQGKGMGRNKWHSERGKNLLFSLLIEPLGVDIREQYIVSIAAAVALWEALDEFLSANNMGRQDGEVYKKEKALGQYDREKLTIKWPNDIFYGDKKLCGTLIEVFPKKSSDGEKTVVGRSIIGTGVNVNETKFPADLPRAVSLACITGRRHGIEPLLGSIAKRTLERIKEVEAGGCSTLLALYNGRLYRRESFYAYRDKGGEFLARLLEVLPDGRLVLKDEGGSERRYYMKEVEYVF